MVVRTTIATFLILALTTAAAFAGGPRGMRAWWNDADVVKSLALTPQEQATINDMQYKMRVKAIDAGSAMNKARLTIKNLLVQKTVDEAQVNKQVEIIANSEAEMAKSRTDFLVGVRKLIGYERFNKLETLYNSFRGRGPGKGGPGAAGRGPGRGMGAAPGRGMGAGPGVGAGAGPGGGMGVGVGPRAGTPDCPVQP